MSAILNERTAAVLESIIRQYIARAQPVSSAAVIAECYLEVCSATVRNDMARLEEEGYISHPHHAAGSIPTEKGYRYYVEKLKNAQLPLDERLLINHLFHQIEKELDSWLSLAVGLVSQRAQNVAVVTSPRQAAARFHHLELVPLQDRLSLAVLIMRGARVRQQLVSFEKSLTTFELGVMSDRLNHFYGGLTRRDIEKSVRQLSDEETLIKDAIIKMMRIEEEQQNQEPHMEGLKFFLGQPEFMESARAQPFMDLVERRQLGEIIESENPPGGDIRVFIGQENRSPQIKDYSLVLGHYGLPDEAVGSIGVIGPTRMPYDRTIASVRYLAGVMSALVAELYGREPDNSGQ